jgi:hypothetical protein
MDPILILKNNKNVEYPSIYSSITCFKKKNYSLFCHTYFDNLIKHVKKKIDYIFVENNMLATI